MTPLKPKNDFESPYLIFGFIGVIDTAEIDFGDFRTIISANTKPYEKRF
jgi:hypothetical protein